MYMTVFVSITSQGQISIPAKMRRALGLDNFSKAVVDVVDNKIIIEPLEDILSLEGILSKKAKKDKTILQIIRAEKRTFAKAVAEKYRKQ